MTASLFNFIPAVFKEFNMKYRLVAFIFIIFIFVLVNGKLEAQEPVILDDSIEKYPIGLNTSILEDTGNKLRFQDVTSKTFSDRFKKSDKVSPSYGFTDSVFWIRFTLRSKSIKHSYWLMELDFPLMDKISLFVPNPNGEYTEKRYGYSMPFAQRDIRHRNFVFKLDIQNGEKKTYYLRFENADRMEIPLTLWSATSFQEKNRTEQYIFGIYLGIIFVMFLYNLFLFFSIKDRTYLYYVLYILGFGFFQLTQNGLVYEYFLPEFLSKFNHYIPFATVFLLFIVIHFSQSFLNTKVNTQKINVFLSALKYTQLVLILFIPFISYPFFIQLESIMASLILIAIFTTGIIIMFKGYRPAKYFVFAWTSLIIGGIVFAFKVSAFLPNNVLTSYAMQVGSVVEVILLSLGLGDRINMMKSQNEKIQQEALAAQTRMTESFSRFVPKEFLQFLNRASIVDVDLGDQVIQKMTILFSDIRSFTSISEKLSPQENIDFLNSYLTGIGPIIRKNNGFIDKYIGDAIMALFPESAEDAVRTAIDMQKQVSKFNNIRTLTGKDPIQIGIGIHIGDLMLGTIGESHRIDTTVISDAVNIASRLESLTKKIDYNIIISKDVFNNIKERDKYNCKTIGRVKIRGRMDPITVIGVEFDEI